MRSLPIVLILVFVAGSGCSVDNARNHYVLAEKLWADKNYLAAVSEFEKVIAKDPNGKLGKQALFRAAMTEYLFLYQYGDAVRKFRKFIQGNSDKKAVWEAQLQIGELLFSKLEQYDQVVLHYRALLKENQNIPEAPEFLFRIGKSQFFLFQFSDAIRTYEDLIKKYPRSPWAEKASYEIGVVYFTRGEQHSDEKSDKNSFDEAIRYFKKFITAYPQSTLIPEAQFGIASCYEELDEFTEALEIYSSLSKTYPAPRVIETKQNRIRERMAQRKR